MSKPSRISDPDPAWGFFFSGVGWALLVAVPLAILWVLYRWASDWFGVAAALCLWFALCFASRFVVASALGATFFVLADLFFYPLLNGLVVHGGGGRDAYRMASVVAYGISAVIGIIAGELRYRTFSVDDKPINLGNEGTRYSNQMVGTNAATAIVALFLYWTMAGAR